MAKIINRDFLRKQVAHDVDDQLIIETSQDITDIIEQNKKEYNANNGRWGDDAFDNKIASIPLTVIDMLNQKGIMNGFAVKDQKEFRKWLNDPDNRVFRTRQGRI